MCVHAQLLSLVQLSAAPWTVPVLEISQARILEWITIFSSRGSSPPKSPRVEPESLAPPALADGFFTTESPRKSLRNLGDHK